MSCLRGREQLVTLLVSHGSNVSSVWERGGPLLMSSVGGSHTIHVWGGEVQMSCSRSLSRCPRLTGVCASLRGHDRDMQTQRAPLQDTCIEPPPLRDTHTQLALSRETPTLYPHLFERYTRHHCISSRHAHSTRTSSRHAHATHTSSWHAHSTRTFSRQAH